MDLPSVAGGPLYANGSCCSMAYYTDERAHDQTPPITIYQWNGLSWNVVRDGCREGYMRGKSPTEIGFHARHVAECVVVECIREENGPRE